MKKAFSHLTLCEYKVTNHSSEMGMCFVSESILRMMFKLLTGLIQI